jgi:hypothetical protein
MGKLLRALGIREWDVVLGEAVRAIEEESSPERGVWRGIPTRSTIPF